MTRRSPKSCAARSSISSSSTTTSRSRPKPFVGGISAVPVSGKVFDAEELKLLVESSLDFWLTTGRFAEQFEKAFAKVMGVRHAMLCNSGSSANLLAVTALTSPRLGKRRLVEGDEVLTVAAGLPDDGEPDPAEPARPGVRRRAARHVRRGRRAARRGGRSEDARHRHGAHAWATRSTSGPSCASPRHTTCGSSRTRATRSAPRYDGKPVGSFGASRDHELLSRAPHHDGRGRVRAHRSGRRSRRSSSRSATGVATAGARRARTTRATVASTGSSASCRTATTTSTSTRTSGTT